MEDLPDHLLVEIFDRLYSAADLARCRLVSKRLCSASYNVHSISVLCSNHRLLLQVRDPASILPFKSLLKNLVSLFDRRYLHSLSVEFENYGSVMDEDGKRVDNVLIDDVWLTDQKYFASFLGGEMGPRLISLVVKDFCKLRKSTILELLSTNCKNLRNLEISRACLSVKGLKPMLTMRSLTLDDVKLDDEDLDKINECFPFLEVLKVIEVWYCNPKIQLQTLKTCEWRVWDVACSLSFTICAPMLTKLRLRCIKPKHAILKTPELHCLELVILKEIEFIEVETFLCLRSLVLRSAVVGKLLQVFRNYTVDRLDVEVPRIVDTCRSVESTASADLITSFPAATTLRLGPRLLSDLQQYFLHGCLSFESLYRSLRTLILHLPELEFEFSVLSFMVSACPFLSEIVFIFTSNTSSGVLNNFTSSFALNHPGIKWSRQQVSYSEWLCLKPSWDQVESTTSQLF